MMRRIAGLAALLGAVLLWTPSFAVGQSIASGSLTGRVVDEGGTSIFDADVTLLRPGTDTGVPRITNRVGEFTFEFLAPGDYSLRVEAVGYRPMYVTSVPVRPGGGVPVVIALREEAPPVSGVDTMALPGLASERVRLGESRWLGSLELERLPDGARTIEDLLGLTAESSPGVGLEGLPASMMALYVDGLRVRPLSLPGIQRDPLFGALVPRNTMSGLEVIRGNGETEWNSAGGVASIVTRPAGAAFGARAFGDYTGTSLWSSSSLSGDAPDHTSIRGGAVVDLPVVPDTVLATFGVEVQRLELPRLPFFENGSVPVWVGTVGGLEGVLDQPFVENRDLVSAFGRVDWRLASDARVSLRANVASVPEADPVTAGTPLIPGDRVLSDGRDVSAAATVQVPMDDDMQLEVKAGLVSSTRSYGRDTQFPFTRVPELPAAIGTHPALPAEISSTVFEFAPVGTFTRGNHTIKVGIGATFGSYDVAQAFGTLGDAVLGGAQGSGVISQTGGTNVRSDYSTVSYSVFAQDSWNASPGVHLLFGARADVDQLPEDDIRVSQLYDSLFVGQPAAAREDTLSDVRSFGTRFSFVWDVAEENRTFVRGGAGLSYDPIDPTLIHEWITGDGRRTVSTAIDAATWPNVPAAGAGRPWLTMTGPVSTVLMSDEIDPKRARTSRAHFAFTRAMGDGVAFHIGTAFRRTEQLARRLDVNLTPSPSGVDQFGRPLFGQLLKRGSAVTATPTLNRRFPGLAQVDFLVFDGWSEYRDVSVGIERRAPGLQLFANYTFSKTEDNMVGWGNPDVNERRVPILDEDGGSDWSEGLSDFDVPHRLVAGFSLDVAALPGLQLSGVYRRSSGMPFTPAFRPGVDINGDGAFSNDPAFVGGVDLSSVGSEWDCVRSAPTGAIDRNSCRGEAVQSVDLRLSFALSGESGLELIVDALNLIEPDIGIRDNALYLVDPLASITRSGDTTTIPLAANPNFGNLSVMQTPGRILRVGLRVAR